MKNVPDFKTRANMRSSSIGLKEAVGEILEVDYIEVDNVGVTYIKTTSNEFYASNSANVRDMALLIINDGESAGLDKINLAVKSGKSSGGREFLYLTIE